MIATSFLENQWEMSLGDHLEIADLPAVIFTVEGETQLKPCAEAYLHERLAESFLARGVMPLASFKNRNAARLLRFQSIAEPPRTLAGPWS
jgi:type VI secretion system protein ImpC